MQPEVAYGLSLSTDPAAPPLIFDAARLTLTVPRFQVVGIEASAGRRFWFGFRGLTAHRRIGDHLNHGVRRGIAVGDILDAELGDEVVIGTVGGEIIIMDENLMNVLWRANVRGSAGFYNSVFIEDLDGDAHNELYVSGSFGIWRFNP